VAAEKSIPSQPRHAAVSEKTLSEVVVACFQDPGRAVGSRWDNPSMKQEMEGFAGRRMGVYSEPPEGQNRNSRLNRFLVIAAWQESESTWSA
jgi:hypothetical protein